MTNERFCELFDNAFEIYESGVDMSVYMGYMNIGEIVEMFDEINYIGSLINEECLSLKCSECELYNKQDNYCKLNEEGIKKFVTIMWALDKNITEKGLK